MELTQPTPDLASLLGETIPLLGAVAVAGPPVLFIAAPWLLFALLLSGPFAVVLALLAALVAAAVLIAFVVAILASPYLLRRRRRAAHTPVVAERMPVEVTA
jgi:hypothetical protein